MRSPLVSLEPLLAPGAPKENPWLVPNVIQPRDPLCSNMDIPLLEAARSQILREKDCILTLSEVLGISLCPTRHMEEGEATFIGQNILRDILQGAFPMPEYPNFDFPWVYLISSPVRRFCWNERKAELNDY